MRNVLLFLVSVTLVANATGQDNWYPSKHGAADTLGAINHLSPGKVLEAAKLIKTGKTYPLGVVTGRDTPAYPPRTYSITVIQPGQDPGPLQGSNNATYNDDLITTWVGIGSQIDGLGHMGIEHTYYNGNKAKDFVTTTGLTQLSVDKLPPIVTRGVVLDMTQLFGKNPLPAGTAFNEEEIKAQANRQGVDIGKGDVVLFYTGWLNVAAQDGEKFMAGEPGLGMGGARFLASLDVVAVGSDTWGVEATPHENPQEFFPVHCELLAKNGIYLLEVMDTRELVKDKAWEFLFVLGQARFEGSVQAVINPVAIR